MATYHTHLQNHAGLLRDEQGSEFANDDEAIRNAGHAASGILSDDLGVLRSPVEILVMIERADGAAVATIEVAATILRQA